MFSKTWIKKLRLQFAGLLLPHVSWQQLTVSLTLTWPSWSQLSGGGDGQVSVRQVTCSVSSSHVHCSQPPSIHVVLAWTQKLSYTYRNQKTGLVWSANRLCKHLTLVHFPLARWHISIRTKTCTAGQRCCHTAIAEHFLMDTIGSKCKQQLHMIVTCSNRLSYHRLGHIHLNWRRRGKCHVGSSNPPASHWSWHWSR